MAVTFGPSRWHFDNRFSLGECTTFSGGNVICVSGGIVWIVAPNTTEVTRNGNSIDDAVTTANANASCGDWFVPTCAQLKNPGFCCRTYWDSYSLNCYFSSTQYNASNLWAVCFNSTGGGKFIDKVQSLCVRAFRCVTY